MRLVWLLIVMYAANVACTDTKATGYLDRNDDLENDNAAMWTKLFATLNTMTSEIEKLSQGQAHLNKRFDELTKRLEDHENQPPKPMGTYQENRADFNKRKNELIATVQEIRGDLNQRHTELLEVYGKRQDTQDNLLRQSFSYNQKWTTILCHDDRKLYGSEYYNFNKTWLDYQQGFNDAYSYTHQFIGLDQLHELTAYESAHELMIILKDGSGKTRYAKYDLFLIGSEDEKYTLKKLGAYSGDAGDSLTPHLGHKFSTHDQDNDDNDETNCASAYGGGWWFFGDCQTSLLTGPARDSGNADKQWGISWSSWHGWNYSLQSVEMKIRPTLQTHIATNF